MSTLLSVRDLRKSFGAVDVLHGVSFTLGRGKILGLVGENGAGKSTLVRCLCGHLTPNAGEISLDGTPYLVPQEFTLVASMSVAENLFLGRELRRGPFVDVATQRAAAAAALARVDAASIAPDALVETLSVAAKQKVELAKALIGRADLLVLDEPTTVLSTEETAALFAQLRALRDSGVGMLYISHKLGEVLDLCDEVAVLRDGALVAQKPSGEWTEQALAEAMVGRPLAQIYPPKLPPPAADAPCAFAVNELADDQVVRGVSFTLRTGEILGLAGMAGAGRTELCELLCGARRATRGTAQLFGDAYAPRNVEEALARGVAYLSEDRQGTALLTESSIAENTVLSSLRRYTRGPFLLRGAVNAATRAHAEALHLRYASVDQPARSLSGGNQQKVAIAKALDTQPRVFLVDEPTRGVDVGARSEIYRIVHDLAAQGMAVLLVSSDLGEILGNCTRTLVMRDGRIAGELEGDELSEANIVKLALGVE